ncbi:MAG: hypothetical protein GF331_16000 [Chitinivibrionales bacterium]|nr:hypothetical protein [Chitinivibrionales bacterium]
MLAQGIRHGGRGWVVLLLVFAVVCAAAAEESVWRVLPIRSQQEYEQGMPGGEGEQHLHGIARCLRHPERIYLSHDVAGAWRSVDGGESWQKCRDIGLHVNAGQSIAVDPTDPDIVFIVVDNSWNWLSTSDEGLYRSTDGGEHWTRVLQTHVNFQSGLHRMYQHNIAFDPASADNTTPASRWYAAFHDNGLYRSDNGGQGWTLTPVSSLQGHARVFCVRTHPTDGRTVYVGTDQGLLMSDSLGYSLRPAGNLPPGDVTSIEIDPREPSRVYVTVRGDGLFRSEDGAETFVELRDHPVVRAFMNPGFPNTLYVLGTSKNSIVTTDGGQSWYSTESVTTFPGLGRETGWRRWVDGDMAGVVPNPLDSLEAVAYSRSTLFKTVDAARHYHESAAGFTGNAWSWWNGSVAFDRLDPDRIAFFCCDVGMRITLNGGLWFEPATNAQAWTWYQAGDISWVGTYAGDFQPRPGSQTIVQAIGNYWDTRLCRSTDNGHLWELIPSAAESDHNLFVSYHPHDPDYVYAGNKISEDGGVTFTAVDFGPFDRATMVGMCRGYPDVVYAMPHDRTVLLRSRDRGRTWNVYSEPGWAFRKVDPLPTFAADPADSLRVYSIDASGDLAVFDGDTWTSLHVLDSVDGPGWNFVRSVTVDPDCREIVYAGMFAAGAPCVYRSTDTGHSWIDVSGNLPRTGIGAMAVNPHTGELYKGSAVGTWILSPPYAAAARRPRPASARGHGRALLGAAMRGKATLTLRYRGAPSPFDLVILDARGRVAERVHVGRATAAVGVVSLDISHLSPGAYHCTVLGHTSRSVAAAVAVPR